MATPEAQAEAFDLIVDLTLELEMDFDLPPEVHKRVTTIQALAKHRYDIRSIDEIEMMKEWKQRFNEADEAEE